MSMEDPTKHPTCVILNREREHGFKATSKPVSRRGSPPYTLKTHENTMWHFPALLRHCGPWLLRVAILDLHPPPSVLEWLLWRIQGIFTPSICDQQGMAERAKYCWPYQEFKVLKKHKTCSDEVMFVSHVWVLGIYSRIYTMTHTDELSWVDLCYS